MKTITTIKRKNVTIERKNVTIKNKLLKPSLKILNINYPLYASKKYQGNTILEYTKKQEDNYHDSCLFGNISWFGDLEQARGYKTKEQEIYKWTIKKPTNLLIMNYKNENFFDYYFKTTKIKLKTAIDLTPEKINKAIKLLKKENININNMYLNMTTNERAYFEFKFVYGYINIEEQYQFMKLIEFFIDHKIIDIKMRDGSSIINKLKKKIYYYEFLNQTITNKHNHNRLSIYLFDKYAINNLCKIIPHKYKIDGILQYNTKSFWFPDLIVYKMNIKEYVLFNPHNNLIYDSIVK